MDLSVLSNQSGQQSSGQHSTRQPERDWLTGLASRPAFTRAIGQVDADRDPAAVLVVEVANVAELNQSCGWDAGDALLTSLGQALGTYRSVDVTVARLTGNRFGLLRAPIDPAGIDLAAWAGPIVAHLRTTINRWQDQLIDLDRSPLASLVVQAGTAHGRGAQAWLDADLALKAGNRSGCELTLFEASDPFISEQSRLLRLHDQLGRALRSDRLTPAVQELASLAGQDRSSDERPWRRVDAVAPTEVRATDGMARSSTDTTYASTDTARSSTSTDQVVPADSELARTLDRWLLATVCRLVDDDPAARWVVPLRGWPTDRRALDRLVSDLEQLPLPPRSVLFELPQKALDRLAGRQLLKPLGDLMADRQISLLISGHTGCWSAWAQTTALPTTAIKPDAELVRAATQTDSPASRILQAAAANVRAAEQTLVAPTVTASDHHLSALGFDLVERAASPLPEPVHGTIENPAG